MTIDLAARGRIKGANLINWRHSLGWSAKRAAAELQTPWDTYRQWERDIVTIPSIVEIAMDALTKKHGVANI